jgi:hypothetical protein
MAKATEPKSIPGFSMGVRTNAAVRMVKLAAPICPYSKQEMERTPDGRWVPKLQTSGTLNCQLEGGQWWVKCEERGHDPYYSTRVWYTTKDLWEDDGDGNQVLTGTKTIRHEERRPNIVQCPVGLRYGGANDPYYKIRRAKERKGRKPLRDIGYDEVCQYRNCQRPVHQRFRSREFGDYCSLEHLQLVAADWRGIKLVQMTGRFELGQENEIKAKRDAQLREAAAYAFDA